ncbi:MAG TPA: pyridoxamine 5'-phosphate oxidase family protein [Acidimicrobiales bacterium]
MATWSDVEVAAPELAETVRRRFEAYGLGLMATIRRDGSPRISPVEPLFADGELWLGMMPDSRKAADLLRDPRFALHCATVDKNVAEGDVKVAGRAVPVEDEADFTRFLEAFKAATGYAPGAPGSFALFTADVREMSTLKPAGDHLDIESWREGRGVRKVERY